ncbi:MAG: 3-deoxy-manno-octulosonate cytidylyltransferase [Gemmatimonadota bacterium]|nr:3-deoxy-manno-octulosonate cytidylyltransferase [Gemmatimonadota bacterium]
MKTAIVIPARLGATRLPHKPLRDLAGQPLVVRVWRRVSGMRLAPRVVIATDHEDVARAASDAGAEVVITSAECASGTARVAEVAQSAAFAGFDSFVNVQGDEPFISAAVIRAALGVITEGRFGLGTVAARASAAILDAPSIVKVVAALDGRAMYFSRAPIPFLRDASNAADVQLRRKFTLQHIGVYSYTRASLAEWMALPPHPLEDIEHLEQLRPLAHNMSMGVAVVDEPIEAGIDTEADLRLANERWSTFAAGEE